MSTRVKVCGITNLPDAEASVAAGADALGFIFAQSPRRVDVDTVRSIVRDVPLFVATIGVFVDVSVEEVQRTMHVCGLSAAQLHGDESEQDVFEIGPAKTIKAVRVRDVESIDRVANSVAHVVLVEPYVLDLKGGTGQVLERELARKAIATGRKIMLAGGLTPDNVFEVVRALRPYAVDVGSGVEASPGRKDHAKLSAFVAAVREADREALS